MTLGLMVGIIIPVLAQEFDFGEDEEIPIIGEESEKIDEETEEFPIFLPTYPKGLKEGLKGYPYVGEKIGFSPFSWLGAMSLAWVIFYVIFYVYFALCLQMIAKKTGTPNGWLAWIPIANVFLMIMVAAKPLWWFILCLIPLVNIVIAIILWMKISERRGKPSWLGILMIVPVANFIVSGYLAFSK